MAGMGSGAMTEGRQALSSTAQARYGEDEYGWLQQQAGLLRAGRLGEIDAQPLAELLTDMAKSDIRALRSAMRVLLLHLLKALIQPDRLTGSWVSTIIEQQEQAAEMIADSPGMTPMLPKLFDHAYNVARRQAAAETGLPLPQFPPDNPWTLDEALAFVPPEPPPRGRRARTG